MLFKIHQSHSNSQGSWSPSQLSEKPTEREREIPTHFHTYGQFRLSTSLMRIYIGCERKPENMESLKWHSGKLQPSQLSFRDRRALQSHESWSHHRAFFQKDFLWIHFTTRTSVPNLADILNLTPRLSAAAHRRKLYFSHLQWWPCWHLFGVANHGVKNFMQMVDKNAWAQTHFRHEKCWQINQCSPFQGWLNATL